MNLKRFATCAFILSIGFHAKASLVSQEMTLPESFEKELKSFEPSAAVYLKDLNRFLLASDDTNENDDPLLFQMDQKGHVEGAPIKVKGLKKMTDIESISQDEYGSLYLLSSQSLNKNGKDKSERNLFVRASRTDRTIKAEDAIQLRPMLLEALKKSKAREIAELPSDLGKTLDVESHFVRENSLYIGLKEPQPQPGTAVIVKVGDVDNIFAGEKLQLEVYKAIDFASITGEADLLSDIVPIGNSLFLTTTQEKGPGRFWQYEEATDTLILLKEFRWHPEGLAFSDDGTKAMIVFDEGLHPARFAFGKY